MKAMILAAGRGERMRPLTDEQPKPLLSVAGKPLIVHHIEKLVQAGFTEVVINHAWLGEKIEQFLGDGSQFGIQILYSPECEGGLETAGGIINALPLLGNAPFWVINGDIWCDLDFSCFNHIQLRPECLAHLFLVNNPAHHLDGDFQLEGSLIKNEGISKLTFSGIGLYHPNLFSGMVVDKTPLAPILRQAMDNCLVTGEYFNGQWFDIGTPERLIEINTLLK